MNPVQIWSSFLEKMSELPGNIAEGIKQLGENPLTIVVLLLLLMAVIMLSRVAKIPFSPKLMAQVAIVVAITAVLNMITLYKMPQGGSVTLASMVPLLLISFAYGPAVGIMSGFLFGIVNFFLGPYIMHPLQVLLDYPVAFMMIGVAGAFPRHMNLGAVIATLLRMMCHVATGWVFFASFAPAGQHPLIYSLIYNGSFLAVDLAIALVVLNLIPTNRLVKALNPKAPELGR